MKSRTFAINFGRALGVGVLAMGLLASPLGASTLDDEILHVKVQTVLLEKLGSDAMAIDIDVHGSTVLLTGAVKKKSTQELSRDVAASVAGVKKVEDAVVVASGYDTSVKAVAREAKREIKDVLLESHVKGRLLDQVGENALKIEVEASDGIVSLRGQVPTPAIRETAMRTAKGTSGVVRVVDLIKIG